MRDDEAVALAAAELKELRATYAEANPRSREAHRLAGAALPGGNTRTVLHFSPFPLTMERGEGTTVWDVDGHRYLDCVGEFSAGIYGHSDPTIRAALIAAAENGLTLGAPTRLEAELAMQIRDRFPSMELLRFCNSGTEANILALMTAIAATGRRKILVCREAYHGGVLAFAHGGSPINLPFEYVFIDYNDASGAAAAFARHGPDLAAAIVEPILGAGGNIPGTAEFLRTLHDGARSVGALLIFDEVKTSRCGPGGIQRQLGLAPDLTTLGKYIGGGLPLGAFGGRRDIMSRYDPTSPAGLRHAGTFNNNVCSMASGLAGLRDVLTPARSQAFFERCERFRQKLNSDARARQAPVTFLGLGSMFTIHFTRKEIASPRDIGAASKAVAQLFHMWCLRDGLIVTTRGDFFLCLPATDADFGTIRETVERFIDSHRTLLDLLE